jgi:lysylphosphatidylglycerol synthetase-like protein (DUF2156 family)
MLRKSLAAVALLFVGAMVVNTLIALHYRWPAMFDAPGNAETIATDFILHGTRISPPVHALVILSLAGVFALLRGWRGVLATIVLVAFAVLVTIAAAGEPAGLPENDVPKLAWVALGTIGRYAPILIIALGLSELARRFMQRPRQGSAGNKT